jgi:hypothetical protein
MDFSTTDFRDLLRLVFVVSACCAILWTITPLLKDLRLGGAGKQGTLIVETNSLPSSKSTTSAFVSAAQATIQKYLSAVNKYLTKKDIGTKLPNANPFIVYACFLLSIAVISEVARTIFERRGLEVVPQQWIWFFSAAAEGLGLLFLRFRIHQAKRVAGISCKALILYALMFAWRASVFPDFDASTVYSWTLKAVELGSCCLVFDVIRLILVIYRDTYQEELDIVQVKHVVGACFLLTMLFSPERGNGQDSSRGFTMQIYVDSVALLPQVVLMARQDCPVPAPIAHFVVATAMSRLMDLFYWTEEYSLWENPGGVIFSGWVVILCHVLNLAIVTDFLYYWVKARMSGYGFDQDTPIPSAYDP